MHLARLAPLETMIHLFARAPDDASLEKVRILAQSLKLVKR